MITRLFSLLSLLLVTSNTNAQLPYNVKTDYMLSGTGYSNELYTNISSRFSTVFDSNFHVFSIENNNNKTNYQNLISCFDVCDSYNYCNGIFFRLRNSGSMCRGLSYLGKMAETRINSYSYSKTRHHFLYDPMHSIYGFVNNLGETNYNSTVFLDENLNGLLDENEPFVVTNYDGFYSFHNLSFSSYFVNQKIYFNGECTQNYPDVNGSVLGVYDYYDDGFPDLVLNYFDSGRGSLNGLELGKPHGATIDSLLHSDGIPMSELLQNINISLILNNNSQYVLILSEDSYVTLGFSHDIILNEPNSMLHVSLLGQVNPEDSLSVNVSQDNVNWYYLGDVDYTNGSLVLGIPNITIVRAVRLIGKSSLGVTRGAPFISLHITHNDVLNYSYGYFVNLDNHEHLLNFTNYCVLPTTTTTTTTTTTSTTTSTTATTTTTSTTTSTTTTTTTSTTTSTTTTTTTTTPTIPPTTSTTTITATFTTTSDFTTTIDERTGSKDTTTTPKSSVVNDNDSFFSDTDVILISVFSSIGFILLVVGIIACVHYTNKKKNEERLKLNNTDMVSFQNPLFVSPESTTDEF